MRTRKFWCSFLLLLIVSIGIFSLNASALPASSPQAAPKGVKVVTKTVSGQSVKMLVNSGNGKAVTGYTGLAEYPKGSGNYYFFKSKNGIIYTNCFVKKGTTTYCVRPTGILWKGWWNNGKAVRYYDPVNLKKVYGWKKIGKYYHYFSTNYGNLQTGFRKINGYTYYLNPKNNGARAYGWRTIGGKKYYFGAYARMKTGLFAYNGKKYYANKSGAQQTGLVTVNNKTYYFDPSTGAAVTGWKTVNGKRYYFSTANSAVTGWYTHNGKKYYFNKAGVMQKGWLTIDNKKYYLNPSTGAMTTGKATIGGKTYDFGTKGYIDVTPTGTWNIKVNLSTCVVTVYRGTTPVKAILCSPGLNGATPTGTRYIGDKLRWHALNGGVYGQYCSHLSDSPYSSWSSYLFHSVYYYQQGNLYSLSWQQFQKLGQPASQGCIRLAAGDAYYIYQNCPIGTKVVIFYGTSADDPLGKPAFKYAGWSQGYDPTDPAL